MKKIMFNDRYGLTDAVLTGRKTQTRRIISQAEQTVCWPFIVGNLVPFEDENGNQYVTKSKYLLGEVVAVAQRYYDFRMPNGEVTDEFYELCCKHHVPLECLGSMEGAINKMFVRADLMPHQICFTNRRVERLQEISDEDCLAEGVQNICDFYGFPDTEKDDWGHYKTPREAYAALINKVSGKGTWESNPWVLAYDFELVM